MEWLKELLKGQVEDEKIDGIVESFNKEFPKHAVPKSEFNTVKEDLKIAKAQEVQTATILEQLKTEAGSVEDYKTKLTELNTQLETVKTESQKQISNVVKKVNFEKLLISNKMNEAAVGLVVDKINFDEVVLDKDGNIVDADTHIEKMKSSYGSLFLTVNQDSQNKDITKDKKPTEKSISDFDTFEEYAKSIDFKGITR